MSVAINIEDVVKRYGDQTVINGLSIDIKPGELFTLLGPSGCGKTTLLRMIIGFNSIEGGAIKIDDKVVNNIPISKRNMGMVFQNYAIFPHMNVKDNIGFGLKNKKLDKSEIESRIADILKVVQIEDFKNRMPDKLSGGQQQRVALARAIVIHPKVLLMDEPLSNLDAKLRIEMRNAIKNIQQQVGITTVYVTHDQEEALAISDRIAVMNKGIIQQVGKPKELYERPSNLFVSKFIGTSNVIKAKVERKSDDVYLQFSDGYTEQIRNISDRATNNATVLVSVRPHEFIISTDQDGIKGIVQNNMFLGVNTHYFVELEDGNKVEVIQDAEVAEIIPEGQSISLKVKTNRVNVFDVENEESLIEEGVANEVG